MTSLFDSDETPTARHEIQMQTDSPVALRVDRDEIRRLLRDTPRLPALARGYGDEEARASADPIGLAGLPGNRDALNDIVVDLCWRLACTDQTLRGSRLVEELGLAGGTRALRLLVAYAHVHHRIRAIVGVPGSGYCWGPNRDKVYEVMAAHARRMGRCFFFSAALYGRGTPAVEAAQMVLDFVSTRQPSGQTPDELASMMQAEGVKVEHVLSAIIDHLAETPDGRKALKVVGAKHESVLVSQDVLARAEQSLASALSDLQAARRAG